ncbi:MAG: sugar nucleotide-binding protein, partial [Nitrososphaeria archaeon]
IIRVASLFGVAGSSGKGGNFVETMIEKARKGEVINVVNDMWMSPTYTKDAAEVMRKMLELNLPFGVYHVTNEGQCTWFQFASEIFKLLGLNPKLNPIKTSQLQAKARRPAFSALKSVKLPKHGIKTRRWENALREYLAEKGHMRDF